MDGRTFDNVRKLNELMEQQATLGATAMPSRYLFKALHNPLDNSMSSNATEAQRLSVSLINTSDEKTDSIFNVQITH